MNNIARHLVNRTGANDAPSFFVRNGRDAWYTVNVTVVTNHMTITRDAFIGELNRDLTYEFGAAVQYVQHAATITGPEYDAISKELIVHSNEEMTHAVSLSNMICDLGGIPTTDVADRQASLDSKEMLEQDLGGEELAITRYKERIAQAEALGEYGVRRLLEDILMTEEEHRRDIMSSLGR